MHSEHLTFSSGRWWGALDGPSPLHGAHLVLVFGDGAALARADCLAPLRTRYPDARIVACSSGGNVQDDRVTLEGAVATAIQFASTTVRAVQHALASATESERVGRAVAAALDVAGLRHVLVFAEGLRVNGSALARGLAGGLPAGVTVTGGLAADGDRFQETVVGLDGPPAPGGVVAVGLYGERLLVGVGSHGGWEPFGPDRRITRSEGNVLYELDGQGALELYKALLGPLGYALPASGLMFPLQVRPTPADSGLVRTILGVDEVAGSLTFAGDVPQGWSARLVRSSLDALIAASGVAAGQSVDGTADGPGLALVVSCIGRRLLLQQRAGEEIASVRRVLGPGTSVAGFYAYGELAASTVDGACELHNQTMTITTLHER